MVESRISNKSECSFYEFEKCAKLRKNIERNDSSYVGKGTLNNSATIRYRKQSLGDFLKQMLVLKNDLNGIENNFRQVGHKFQLLDNIPKFEAD